MIIDPYMWTRLPIVGLEAVTAETLAVHLRRPSGYSFVPGQYAIVRVIVPSGERLIRQYSFISAPQDDDLSLLIQREPGGTVSGWFHSTARVGAIIELSQPLGSFTLTQVRHRPVVLVAGKVGIAPFLSMLRATPHRRAKLIYSVRQREQIVFAEEVATYDTTVIMTDVTPRIDATILTPLTVDQPVWYICGSKQFVDAICLLLSRLNVPSANVRRELFTLQ
ncbi:MAG TPA: FAD-binding oxidoreductase [Candidatus Saccharimonadales bacterium]|jgi:ferredoxin-NADP reductase